MLVKHEQLTEQIIKDFYTVYRALGYGFLEKVYENSLAIELRKMKLEVVQQGEIKVYYAGVVVGEYYADLLVADAVIVEIKAVRTLLAEHEAQLLNYLKATPYEVGRLLNFGPKPEISARCTTTNARGDWAGDKGNNIWSDT